MRTRNRLLTVALVAGALALPAAPALAATPTNFGSHVSTCVQTTGFSGTYNSGMPHGAARWDGKLCQ